MAQNKPVPGHSQRQGQAADLLGTAWLHLRLLWDGARGPAHSEAGSGPRDILRYEILSLRAQTGYVALSYWYRHSQWRWHQSLAPHKPDLEQLAITRGQRSLSTFVTLQENWMHVRIFSLLFLESTHSEDRHQYSLPFFFIRTSYCSWSCQDNCKPPGWVLAGSTTPLFPSRNIIQLFC